MLYLKVLKAGVWVQAYCAYVYINIFLHTFLCIYMWLSFSHQKFICAHTHSQSFTVIQLSVFWTVLSRIGSLRIQSICILMFHHLESFPNTYFYLNFYNCSLASAVPCWFMSLIKQLLKSMELGVDSDTVPATAVCRTRVFAFFTLVCL